VVTDWNALAVQCISTATPPARGGPPGLFDLALMHVAVHDAVQAIEHRFEPYHATPTATGGESPASAAAAAAHDVLVVVCPTAAASLDAAFKPYKDGMDPGLAVGSAAATALLPLRRPTPTLPDFTGGTGIGEWRPTPPGNLPMQFVFMATTEPFTLSSPDQFRPEGPPAVDSRQYAREYDEVKKYGAVESHPAVATCPAPSRTEMARFWSGNFGAQWNETTRLIALDGQLSIGDSARLLALVNLAAADAAIAVWDSKLYFNFWRPITAIREGENDLNPLTTGDPAWTPFIQSAHFPAGSQNPAYPDYVSGANGLTGAFTRMLRLYFRSDWFRFYVNKATPPAVAICTNPRTFRRFSEAAEEVVDARIWLGIHFRTADVDARKLGERVAWWAFSNFLRPIGHGRGHDRDDRER
jgi:PAP2 superfamily